VLRPGPQVRGAHQAAVIQHRAVPFGPRVETLPASSARTLFPHRRPARPEARRPRLSINDPSRGRSGRLAIPREFLLIEPFGRAGITSLVTRPAETALPDWNVFR
jgi:hypothetical protein